MAIDQCHEQNNATVKESGGAIGYHIRLRTDACLDLDWCLAFLPSLEWLINILEYKWSTSPSMSLFTDASGSLGWGAYWSGHWIQLHGSPEQAKQDIVWKELFAIASAVHCDNQTVVDIWKNGTTNCPRLMYLVRMLYFFAAQHNMHIISHVVGTDICIADALSCFQVHRFHRKQLPAQIPSLHGQFSS